MLAPHESLKVNERRALLGAAELSYNATGAGGVQPGGYNLDFYDVGKDCTQPKLLFSGQVVTDVTGHEGQFTPDGLTYYVSNNGLVAYDVSDPSNPKAIARYPAAGAHTASGAYNDDGTRGYWPASGVIVDLSEVQKRVPDAQITVVSQNFPTGSGGSQMARFVKINGVPYVLGADETLTGGNATLVDVSDEQAPVLASRLMLEAQAANTRALYPEQNESTVFGYDSHYCYEDDRENTKAIACAFFQSGVRVFDVRDPYHPKEIAYYIPPARPGYHAAAPYAMSGVCGTGDWATSQSRFRRDRGELWITSSCNGFQILKFAKGVWPFND
jgi:hypothetical protein